MPVTGPGWRPCGLEPLLLAPRCVGVQLCAFSYSPRTWLGGPVGRGCTSGRPRREGSRALDRTGVLRVALGARLQPHQRLPHSSCRGPCSGYLNFFHRRSCLPHVFRL